MLVKFPSISSFYSVRRDVVEHVAGATYRGKVKLHGTNAGVRLDNGELIAQSKERDLTLAEDNYGFARWIDENSDSWLAAITPQDQQITIYGEWCGKGIQSKVSISKIDRKVFCIFAVTLGGSEDPTYEAQREVKMVVDPADIRNIVDVSVLEDVFILPWATSEIEINFNDREAMAVELDKINETIVNIDKSDPWVNEMFDIDGPGEGMVYVPINPAFANRFYYKKLAFKAKGGSHKVVRSDKAVSIDPEVAKSIGDFVDMVITPARLEQGITEVTGGTVDFDMKNIGQFIGWMSKDVHKETSTELEAAGLEWRQVVKPIQTRARQWFIEQYNKV